jgi:NAD(P)-dependent dehydrogenase (short-subunit alcohol dehydrogenase family)
MPRLNTQDLRGRVVVITGAGSGIGQAVAQECAQRGADLALCDVNDAGLATTADLARAAGRTAFTRRVDVADTDQMNDFAETTLEQFGAVDLLVNNAGVGLVGGFMDTSRKDWDWLVSINLIGVVNGCAAFLPAMISNGSGHVANMSSGLGFAASPQLTAYSTTKFAVFGLSEALRIELRPRGIGVTAICPGVINTNISQTAHIRGGDDAARREKLAELYARRGYPADKVAHHLLAAVGANKAVAPIAPEARLLYVLSRLTPPIARAVSARLAALTR